ncbi:hypothetical protein GCM10010420_16690 [Streptomyces glaucosporus]|uniref:Alpha/beta hydrolase n=1 Tax=Streptomyces glaucosporus TaxID=284044 RepID=A0ABP5V2B7_9ACTN
MALSYPTQPGDIDRLIADDHAIVERQFQHLEAGRGDRRALADRIGFELSLHAFAEETVLYPLWLDLGMEGANRDARNEHHGMKELLTALDSTEPGEADFERALTGLMALVRHHVAGEEGEELPAFRSRVGPERMAELGRRFIAAKRQAPPAPHPNAPDSGGITEQAAAALAKPLDESRAAASGKRKRLLTDASGLLDPQAQAVVDAYAALEPLPLETLTPGLAREQPGPGAAIRRAMEAKGIIGPEPVGSVEELRIPDAAGGDQTLRVYTPADPPAGPLPVVMWIHGGGWVLFDTDTYDASCRGLANRAGAIVVSPDYRRAPEAPFPASHDDVLTAYRWTVANASRFGGDPERIGIGGESVGGAMAPATAMQLAAAGEPVPRAQVCVYPLTTVEQYGESMEDAADGRPLSRALLSWMMTHAFEGRPDAVEDPRVDLLGLPPDRLAVMPPTLVITAERDVLRDQGEEFARRLRSAGVPTTLTRYDGVMHEFFGASAVLDKAGRAQRQAAEHFTRAFAGSRRGVGWGE